MSRLVCFDMDGVLSPNAFRLFFGKWVVQFPEREKELMGLFRAKYHLWSRAKVDPGCSALEYCRDLVDGVPGITAEELEEEFRNVFTPFLDVIDLAKTLQQKGIPVGILSNHLTSWVDHFIQKNNLSSLFPPDLVVISQTVQCAKPSKEIFELFYSRVQQAHPHIQKKDILFIDDKAENVSAAQDVGFCGFRFHRVSQDLSILKQHLQSLGIL
eukprot:TRINITY_DN3911_c0_g1_i1.p1 TRINITY_DN3911_c0_g1~~TRINITY_DN3911_c0_g1_i1.p1  ORF type:complete len:213 (-),score=50.61 TRINITY_DN3911_c0_g1_i1:55-693(-)